MILIIKHIAIEGPGIIGEFFNNTKYTVKIIELAEGDKLPKDLRGIEAVISLGGPMNVYEDRKYPFLKAEDIFIKKATRRNIPILGICLGAQIIAKAKSASVKKAKKEEIGWRKISLTRNGIKDPLFDGLNRKEEVFQWHEDTFDIPKDGTKLASSGVCLQAFRVNSTAYGVQFHFEVTPKMVAEWIEKYLSKDDKKALALFRNTNEKCNKLKEMGNRMLLNFTRIIEKVL